MVLTQNRYTYSSSSKESVDHSNCSIVYWRFKYLCEISIIQWEFLKIRIMQTSQVLGHTFGMRRLCVTIEKQSNSDQQSQMVINIVK